MKRLAYQELLGWKQKKAKKPLLLKGARQVGKTHLITEFGKKEFPKIHIFNFQKNKSLSSIFENNIDPQKIIKTLSDYSQNKISPKEDLLFFDEIQECPNALNSLKYFEEDSTQANIIGAGSLLGLYLNEAPFPVGKVEFLNLYPMNFFEFLQSSPNSSLIEFLHRNNQSIPEAIHLKLCEELKTYLVLGGAPEVLNTYFETQNLSSARKKQLELLNTYRADFAKHSGPANALNIMSVFESIPRQLAKENKKFSFKLIESGSRYSKYRTAIEWLIGAGLAHKVPILDHIETPLKAHVSDNNFKLYFFDVGLLGALSELPTNTFTLQDSLFSTFKGAFMENLFLQEFKSMRNESLYCWQGRQSEVEFVFQNESGLFPIEVKSGTAGRLKSLNVFSEKYKASIRTRVSMQGPVADLASNFRNLPLYLSSVV